MGSPQYGVGASVLAPLRFLIINKISGCFDKMESIRLEFSTGTKDVPLRTVVSRKLLRAVQEPIDQLRRLGENEAFVNAVAKNPGVLSLINRQGGVNPEFAESTGKMLRETYKDWTDEQIQAETQKRLQAKMIDGFPEVWEAIANPVTDFSFDNDAAIDASIEVLKRILDDRQLTTEEREEMNNETFWDNQDLQGVTDAVMRFRDRAKLGGRSLASGGGKVPDTKSEGNG
mgnify:CR=1 FL=1